MLKTYKTVKQFIMMAEGEVKEEDIKDLCHLWNIPNEVRWFDIIEERERRNEKL